MQMKLTLKSTEGLRKNSSSFCLEFLIEARNEDLSEHLSQKYKCMFKQLLCFSPYGVSNKM